ncbi:MAG: hypothetical protein HY690_06255 [Chloroflexi bacterium]|nr:hypothetical protein [Chloroflexota bacterium]
MQTSAGIRHLADVRCVHCARVAGQWEWATDAPEGHGTFRAGDGAEQAGVLWRLRCSACGGPVYLEEERSIHAQEMPDFGPMRRGRKPRQRVG